MATFLDIGLFSYFNVIFPVLLIFAVLLAIFRKTNILGGNPLLDSIVAISIALMSLLSGTVIALINFMAPWFVFLFIFIILLVLAYQMLGATEKDIVGFLRGNTTIGWIVAGVGIVIVLAGLGTVFSDSWLSLTDEASGDGEIGENGEYGQNIYKSLFSTKVLGLVVIFLVAIFAIILLSSSE